MVRSRTGVPGWACGRSIRGGIRRRVVNDEVLDLFLEACGAGGPLPIGVGPRNGQPTETRVITQPFAVIGRNPHTDLYLDHWKVSRRHAYVQLVDGRYFCVDLGSRTGTFGGDPGHRMGWLGPGHPIQVGAFSIHFKEFPAPSSPPEPIPGVIWEVSGKTAGPSTWRMESRLVLAGRAPACKIRINEPDISKYHCSLVATAYGVWVVDLLGDHGVFVNDAPVRYALLEDGDELRIGQYLLRPHYDGPILDRPGVPRSPVDASRINLSTPAVLVDRPARTLVPVLPTATPPVDLLPQLGVVDPSLQLVVQHFGMIQQQMYDHFHNSMMMMFEGFAALHREQAAGLRDELARIGAMSAEIDALKAETARLAEAQSEAARSGPPSAATPAAPEARATIPPPDPTVDIHADLCRRLANIQSERQNRWQKLFGMMANRD